MKSKLAIIGAGGHGKVCVDIASLKNKWNEIVFLDNSKVGETILGFEVIDVSENWSNYNQEYDFFIAIGDNKNREKVYLDLKSKNASIAKLIHPSAIIGSDVKVAEGALIAAGVIINPSTKIGRGTILNTGCTIDHDNQIGDFVHISPGARLAGTVSVGKRSWLGIGSVVINNIVICNDVIIGAGGLVIKSIYNSGTYVGNPILKPIRGTIQ